MTNVIRSSSVHDDFNSADLCEFVPLDGHGKSSGTFDIGRVDGTLAVSRGGGPHYTVFELFPRYCSEPHPTSRPTLRSWRCDIRGSIHDIVVDTDAVYLLVRRGLTDFDIETILPWGARGDVYVMDTPGMTLHPRKMRRNTRGDFIITGNGYLVHSYDIRSGDTGVSVPPLIDPSGTIELDAYDRIIAAGEGWVSMFEPDGTPIHGKTTVKDGLFTAGMIHGICVDNQHRLYLSESDWHGGMVKRTPLFTVPNYE